VGRGLVQVRVWVLGEVVGVGGAGYGCRRVQVRVWRWVGGWVGGWMGNAYSVGGVFWLLWLRLLGRL